MAGFQENVKKQKFLTLNPQIKIFFKFRPCHFSYFTGLKMCAVSEIFKDGLTNRLTDNGNYYGPHRVSQGYKITNPFLSALGIFFLII